MYGGGGFHHNARDGNFGDYNDAQTPQAAEEDPNAQLLGLTRTAEAVQGVQGRHTGVPADHGRTAPQAVGAMAPGFSVTPADEGVNRQNWHQYMAEHQPQLARGDINMQGVRFQEDMEAFIPGITAGRRGYDGTGVEGGGGEPTITPMVLENRLRAQITPGTNGGGYNMHEAQPQAGNRPYFGEGEEEQKDEIEPNRTAAGGGSTSCDHYPTGTRLTAQGTIRPA